MRYFFLALSLFLFACGDSSQKTQDLSAAPPDLSLADLAAGSGQTCFQILSCSLDCSGEQSCEMSCRAAGSPTAQSEYDALFACAYAACIGAPDGGTSDAGTGACVSQSDHSAACASCVSAAAASSACADPRSACTGS